MRRAGYREIWKRSDNFDNGAAPEPGVIRPHDSGMPLGSSSLYRSSARGGVNLKEPFDCFRRTSSHSTCRCYAE